MIVACLPAARIIVVKYANSIQASIRSSRRTESRTLPHKEKSISNGSSNSWSGLGRRLKLPMLSFGGDGLMTSIWREEGRQSSVRGSEDSVGPPRVPMDTLST